MGKVLVNETSLSGIAQAIREKSGNADTYKPAEMEAAIKAIETGGGELPEEAFNITESLSYRFANNGWNWFIEGYGHKVTASSVTNMERAFDSSITLKNIPFEINLSSRSGYVSMAYAFNSCRKLLNVPKISGGKAGATNSMFSNCQMLRNIPDDIATWFDWSYHTTQTSAYSAGRNNMFSACYSLRKIPMDFLRYCNPVSSYSGSYFSSGFQNCWVLDELKDLPMPYTATWTSNAFSNAFDYCCRLANLTFELNDGQPYVKQWKNQTIDLSKYVGCIYTEEYMLNYNSGLTADKAVFDAESYERLKDDPDHYVRYNAREYSRYNKASAAETIQSLPDTSAYLSAAGGTNTIKFKADSGELSALEPEVIAQAAAKGWTVSMV